MDSPYQELRRLVEHKLWNESCKIRLDMEKSFSVIFASPVSATLNMLVMGSCVLVSNIPILNVVIVESKIYSSLMQPHVPTNAHSPTTLI